MNTIFFLLVLDAIMQSTLLQSTLKFPNIYDRVAFLVMLIHSFCQIRKRFKEDCFIKPLFNNSFFFHEARVKSRTAAGVSADILWVFRMENKTDMAWPSM